MKISDPFLQVCAAHWRRAAILTPFCAWTIKHRAIGGVLVQDLTLENASVFEREMEDVPVCRVRHGIEPHDRRLSAEALQGITNAAEIALAGMQTADSAKRLPLRH